jgi:NAD(P)-dependent dehydrogenase (short-subunit alcohol dehydrogenase family)
MYVIRPLEAARVDSRPMSIPSSPRAVVTGGASGLGRALCLALARRGAKIVVADLNLNGAEETAHEVERAGGKAVVQRCDVAKPEEVEALARMADREIGGTDLIVNNAGVGVGGAMGEVSLQDWEWVVGINLWGVIYGCHVFIPRFKAQRSGHVLNIASAAGLISAPDMGPYNVTKAGVVSLSETLAAELRDFNIGVTVVCPTFFRTGIVDSARFAGQEKRKSMAVAAMEKSKVQAADVAAEALACCDKNQLFCLPMKDAQWGWRLKRFAPERFCTKILPNIVKAELAK